MAKKSHSKSMKMACSTSKEFRGMIKTVVKQLKIGREWKKPGCPSSDQQIMKMCYVHRKEYYSALINKIKFTGKWMVLEIISMSEVTHSQTNVPYLISFVNISLNFQNHVFHLEHPFKSRNQQLLVERDFKGKERPKWYEQLNLNLNKKII